MRSDCNSVQRPHPRYLPATFSDDPAAKRPRRSARPLLFAIAGVLALATLLLLAVLVVRPASPALPHAAFIAVRETSTLR
jgi:hypothetical protein